MLEIKNTVTETMDAFEGLFLDTAEERTSKYLSTIGVY